MKVVLPTETMNKEFLITVFVVISQQFNALSLLKIAITKFKDV